MIYRTDDPAKWGTGKGANLTPVEIDTNFWDLLSRVVTLETSGVAPNGIGTITTTGSQMTVWLEDGTALGPYTLPTAMIRYRGDWVPAAAYAELDLVAVPEAGIYLVLRDHGSAAAFDANATDAEGNPLYRWLFPIRTALGLAELSGVTLAAPAAGEYLRFDGTAWVDAPLAWADIPDAPATFPPSAHAHPWAEITGRPATIDALPATVGTDGQVLKASAGGIVWGTDESGGSGSGASVSDEGVQILAAPTDLNFAGAGVAVTDDGDGTLTVTISGGGAAALDDLSDVTITAPAAASYLRFDGTAWIDQALAWADIPDRPATFPPETHAHLAAEVSDFAEAVDDRVAALLVAGTNITLSYDDAAGTVTVAASGGGAGAINDLSDVDTATVAPADGQALVWDNATGLWKPGSATVEAVSTYDIRSGFIAVPTGSEVLDTIVLPRDVDLPANFSGSGGRIGTLPTASFAVSVQDDGVEIGTITITTAGAFSFATAGGTAKTLAAGSVLTFVAPATADATAADASWTLYASATGSNLGGDALSVSAGGVQVLAAPSDLNFTGAGVSVTDDGDGSATVTIPGDAQTLQGVAPSAFVLSLLDDADAAAARTTLGAAGLGANTFTASQTLSNTGGVNLSLRRPTATANSTIAQLLAFGNNTAAADTLYSYLQFGLTDPAAGSEDAWINYYTRSGGTLAQRMALGAGAVMSGATGGDMGTGTINAAAYYVNGQHLDYEEGTFTPIIEGSTGAGTCTYTAQAARYVRVGNVVHVHLFVEWNTHTGTGFLEITGLPFASSSAALVTCSVLPAGLTVSAGALPIPGVVNGSTEIWMYEVQTGGGGLARAAIDAAAGLYISGSYRTTA